MTSSTDNVDVFEDLEMASRAIASVSCAASLTTMNVDDHFS